MVIIHNNLTKYSSLKVNIEKYVFELELFGEFILNRSYNISLKSGAQTTHKWDHNWINLCCKTNKLSSQDLIAMHLDIF